MTDWLSQIRIGWLMIAEYWHDKLTEWEGVVEKALCPGFQQGYAK